MQSSFVHFDIHNMPGNRFISFCKGTIECRHFSPWAYFFFDCSMPFLWIKKISQKEQMIQQWYNQSDWFWTLHIFAFIYAKWGVDTQTCQLTLHLINYYIIRDHKYKNSDPKITPSLLRAGNVCSWFLRQINGSWF